MRLFQIEGVNEVSFGPEFITITRSSDQNLWQVLKPHVFGTLTDFFMTNLPVISDEEELKSSLTINDEDDETLQLIKQLLEERIRPYLLDDGGDLEFISWDEVTGILALKLVGACGTCPSKSTTLEGGIEGMMKHYVPEVTKVIQVESEVEQIANDEFQKLEAKLAEQRAKELEAEEERKKLAELEKLDDEKDEVFNMIRTKPKSKGDGEPLDYN